MFKEKFLTSYQIKSSLLLLFASIILALLLGFNSFSYSINSTGFYYTNSFHFFKNSTISFLFKYFGITIYLIPIILLIWSYRLFFNHPNKFISVKILLLLVVLFIAPLAVFSFGNAQNSGLLGCYLNSLLKNLSNYYFILTITIGILLLFISGISIKEILILLKVIGFTFYFILNLIGSFFNNLKLNFTRYWRNKPTHTPQKVKTQSNLSAAFASLDKEMWNKNLINSSSLNKNRHYTPLLESTHEHPLSYTTNQPPIKDFSTTQPSFNTTNNTTKETPLTQKNLQNNSPIKDNYKINNHYSSTPNSYSLPTHFLDNKEERSSITTQEIKELAIRLEQVIKEFGIDGKIVNIQPGPVVTLFEITIPPGVKTSKVISLETDIALRMKAFSVRIAVVPGKDVIGIEIPNQKRKTVYLRKLLEHKTFTKCDAALPLNLGLEISGKPVVVDLATMPHLLVAGTTGSGKSVAINAMILSLLYKLSPQQCKMIMIDPKMLELSIYQDIPHLLTPVVTDPKKAIYALKWAVKQMEHRYNLMSYLGVRNISGYNNKLRDTAFIATIKAAILEKEGYELDFPFMPYIIVIIDEMADLMLVAGKEIEAAVQRLAQMARAAGIHLIMATQRPSVDVITGTIKANFPTRISFQVSSRIDSNTILGDKGAEQLLGKGDMLYMMGVGRLLRVHAPFVSDKEVDTVVSLLKEMASPEYINDITSEKSTLDSKAEDNDLDDLYDEVVNLIKQEQRVSTSYIQRRFQIGYNRAARIVESLEENGVISKASATGKREILIN